MNSAVPSTPKEIQDVRMTSDVDKKVDEASEYVLAAAVARHVELLEVRLGEASVKLTGSVDSLIRNSPWDLRLKRKMGADYNDASKLLTITADLAVNVVPEDSSKVGNDAVSCQCVYYLTYSFHVQGGPEGEDRRRHFEAFANINGIYNIWPYFRELIQSTASRMGIPPIVIPVYRVPRPTPQSTVKPSGDANQSTKRSQPRKRVAASAKARRPA